MTGADTTGPATVAGPTVHAAPPGPVTVIGFRAGLTDSPNVNVTWVGAADNDAPWAGELLCNLACAHAGVATPNTVSSAKATTSTARRMIMRLFLSEHGTCEQSPRRRIRFPGNANLQPNGPGPGRV
ncbi:hypothetical protein GCM10023321_48630 [Pseudonocardia eucalypti]|uniref:Ig-like domain-containing protein n=1 Tax=Pseudonocardia eucalypti TaxID=648755 RepID=A0ABP9QIY0_9PSEU